MTVVADNYAKVLMDLKVADADVETMRELLENSELRAALENPFLKRESKYRVIMQLFPSSVCDFIKVMSDNGDIVLADDLLSAYDQLVLERDHKVRATFTYVTKPDDAQLEKLKAHICRQYGSEGVELTLKEDASLVGGFILAVGDSVLDKSIRSAILKMQRHFAVR